VPNLWNQYQSSAGGEAHITRVTPNRRQTILARQHSIPFRLRRCNISDRFLMSDLVIKNTRRDTNNADVYSCLIHTHKPGGKSYTPGPNPSPIIKAIITDQDTQAHGRWWHQPCRFTPAPVAQ